jgi:hypothetical protein
LGLVSVLVAGCAGLRAPPVTESYSKVAPTTVAKTPSRVYVPPLVDDLDRADVQLQTTAPEEPNESKWRTKWGHMDSHYVTRGGQEVEVVGPDRVFSDWVDEFDYRSPYACPLVLSFDDAPVQYQVSSNSFDWGGPQHCSATDWPTAATPWLALDRDGNGSIDDGAELFGTGVELEGRFARNGFEALGELDVDGDGRLTPLDPAWGQLRLWADEDGDRRSSPQELTSLDAVGVTELDLGYERSWSCSDGGNCEGERSQARLGDGRSVRVIDVYLRCR